MTGEEIEKAATAHAIKIWGDPEDNKRDVLRTLFSFTELQWLCHRDFIVGAKWAQQSQWVKCSERLPEAGQCTLLSHKLNAPNPTVGTLLRDPPNVWWHTENAIWCGLESVTHWMPLPAPPKEEPKE